MNKSLDLVKYVKLVLEDELTREDRFLEEVDVKTLLKDDGTNKEPRKTIFGYPSYPLYREIGNMLQIWMDQKYCPVLDLPKYDLLDEKVYVESRAATFNVITPLLEGLKTLWELWGEEEIKFRIRDILLKLGKRGLLDMLGVRKTVGTKELWPPSRTEIENSFIQRHSPSAEISVGARALAKHFHRDSSSSWWGVSTGTEKAKNEHALSLMNKILNNATWINIHWLPQDIYIVEARQEEGESISEANYFKDLSTEAQGQHADRRSRHGNYRDTVVDYRDNVNTL